jgi:hypothetical protein
MSDNVPQQLQKFVAFLQKLNDWIRACEAEKKGSVAPHNTNTTPRVPPINPTLSPTPGTHPSPSDPSAN